MNIFCMGVVERVHPQQQGGMRKHRLFLGEQNWTGLLSLRDDMLGSLGELLHSHASSFFQAFKTCRVTGFIRSRVPLILLVQLSSFSIDRFRLLSIWISSRFISRFVEGIEDPL